MVRTARRGVASAAAETGGAALPSVVGAVAVGCALVDVAAVPAPSSLILVTITHSLSAMEIERYVKDVLLATLGGSLLS